MKPAIRLGLLALVALVLGGVYFYLSRDTAPSTTGVLYTFSGGDRLQEMRVLNQKGSVRFRREDGRWVIVEPGKYRASQQKAAVMEDFLLALPINRELDGIAPEYGLGDPQATIELLTTGGIRKTLLVGNLTASKAQVYLQDKDSGKVFVSDLGSVTQFDGSLDAYRDKDIFSVDKNNIVEFSYFEDGEKKVTAQQTGGQGWRLTFPYEAPAREIEINEFLVALRKWSAVTYPPGENLDYGGLGLDRPPRALEVMDAQGRKQRLEIGAEADGVLYVRSGSQEDVAGIFSVDADFSNLDPAALVFFQPLHTTIDRVASIEVVTGDRTVTFKLDHATDPPVVTANDRPVSYEAFVSFFVKYIGLSADGHDVEPRPGKQTVALTTTYLDGTTSQVTLHERDGGSMYMKVADQGSFHLSNEKVGLLLDRLDAALADEQ